MRKLLILILLTHISCGMSKTAKHIRKPQDKMWRFCQDFETPEPIAKLCNRTCPKKRCDKDEFITTVKDLTDRETFLFFRSGTFIVIDEDAVK